MLHVHCTPLVMKTPPTPFKTQLVFSLHSVYYECWLSFHNMTNFSILKEKYQKHSARFILMQTKFKKIHFSKFIRSFVFTYSLSGIKLSTLRC